MVRVILYGVLIIGLCGWGAWNPVNDSVVVESGGGATISDDFSTDTGLDYTPIVNGISISGGTAGGSTNWADNSVYHSTSTGSNDHYMQADAGVSASSNADNIPAIVLRCNGNGSTSTGYRAGLVDTDRLYLHSFSGSANTFIVYWTVSSDITTSDTLTTKVQVSGSTFTAWIDLNSDGDFDDANESLGNQTDTTYSTGAYGGLAFGRAGGVDHRIDNLEGDAL